MKSKFFLIIAISIVSSLGLTQCAAYPDLAVEKPKADILHQSVYISAEVKAQAQLHNYIVELNWNKELKGTDGLLLRKFGEDGKLMKNTALAGFGGSLIDGDVAENQTYRYELWNSVQILDEVVIHVPIDLDLRHVDYSLEVDDLLVGRIYLGKDRKLVTNGRDIDWKLLELSAEAGAKLQNFNVWTGAGVGQNSGVLKLEIAQYQGDLTIEWRGQNGAQGARGADAHGRGAKGVGGSDGSSARAGGDSPSCFREPTDGGRGHQGPRGGTGHDGLKGGDLEAIEVSVLDSVDGRPPKLIASSGSGGLGGDGGSGGRGGEGGDPGRSSYDCRKASRGPEGSRGIQGAQGNRGEAGQVLGQVCLRVEGLTLQGKCEKL